MKSSALPGLEDLIVIDLLCELKHKMSKISFLHATATAVILLIFLLLAPLGLTIFMSDPMVSAPTVVLNGEKIELSSFRQPENHKAIHSFLSPFMLRELEYDFIDIPENALIQVRLGEHVFFEGPLSLRKDSRISIPKLEIILAYLRNLKCLGLVLIAGYFLFILCLSLGRSLCSALPYSDSESTPILLVFVGFFVSTCLIGSYAYFFPLNSPLTNIFLVIPVLTVALNSKKRLWQDVKSVSSDLLRFLPALVTSFWPVIYWGYWYLGRLQTDMYEYLSLADAVKHTALFEFKNSPDIQASGGLTAGAGIVWRCIDSVGASFLSQILHMPTKLGFILLAFVSVVLFSFAVTVLLRTNVTAYPKQLVSFIPLFLPLTAMYAEGYFSQFVGTAGIMVFLATSYLALSSLSQSGSNVRWRDPQILASSASTAFCLAIYPYFVAPLLGVIGLFFSFQLIRAIKRILPTVIIVAVLVSVLLGFNILTILNFGQTSQFNAALDLIAKNFVFPFLYSFEYVPRLLGLVAFHFRGTDIDALTSEVKSLSEISTELNFVSGYSDLNYYLAWLFISLGVLSVLVSCLACIKSRIFYFCGAILSALLLVTYIFFSKDQAYAYAKFAWTSSVVGFWLVVIMVFASNAKANRPIRSVFSILVGIIFPTFWVLGSYFDRIPFYLNMYGPYNHTRSHVGLIADLLSLDKRLSMLDGKTADFRIVRGDEKLQGTDRDRVLLVQSRAVLNDRNVRCLNCLGHRLDEASYCTPGNIITIGKVIHRDEKVSCLNTPSSATSHLDVRFSE